MKRIIIRESLKLYNEQQSPPFAQNILIKSPKKEVDSTKKKETNFIYKQNVYFFWFIRLLGIFPMTTNAESGQVECKILSWPSLHTLVVHCLLTTLNVLTTPTLFNNFNTINFTVDEALVYFLFLSFTWNHALEMFMVCEAKKLAKHMNDWGKFAVSYDQIPSATTTKFSAIEDRLYTITGRNVKSTRARTLILILTMSTAFIIIMHIGMKPPLMKLISAYQLDEDMHSILYHFISGSVGASTIFTCIWIIFTSTLSSAAEAIITNIESLEWKTQHRTLSKHLELWLQLRQLTYGFGSALGLTYTFFCGSLFGVSIPTLVLGVHGVRKGQYSTLCPPFVTLGVITLLAEIAERSELMIGRKFEERLAILMRDGKVGGYQTELLNFIQVVASTAPSISLSGYFTMNRSINAGLLSSVITYFVIIIQFQNPTG